MTRSTLLYYWWHFRVWYPIKSFLFNIGYCLAHPTADLDGHWLMNWARVQVTTLEGLKARLSTMDYIPDKGDWRQWPSITLARGGGDCEDLAELARWMFVECLHWKASVHWLIWPNGDAHAVCVAYNPARALIDAKGMMLGHPVWWQLADNREVFSERGYITLRYLLDEPMYGCYGARDIWPEVEWQ